MGAVGFIGKYNAFETVYYRGASTFFFGVKHWLCKCWWRAGFKNCGLKFAL
jgi:hypothetical protein